MQARHGFWTVKFTTKEKCVEGVHKTPLELMLHLQRLLYRLTHNFSPLPPPLLTPLKRKKKTYIPGQVHFCAIFVLFFFFVRMTDFLVSKYS